MVDHNISQFGDLCKQDRQRDATPTVDYAAFLHFHPLVSDSRHLLIRKADMGMERTVACVPCLQDLPEIDKENNVNY